MQRTFLLRGFFATAAIALTVAACGGKVIVDRSEQGAGGQGAGGQGQGGVSTTSSTTGTTSTSTTVTTTTGTGTSCGCSEMCAHIAPCGVSQQQCVQACPMITPDQMQCLCNLPPSCQGIQQCVGGGGSGGGGVPPSPPCNDCRIQAQQNQCSGAFQTCQANPECAAIRQCHKQCGYGPECVQQCDAPHPSGQLDYNALIDCSVCQTCSMVCSNDAIYQTYCVFNGGGG